MKAHENLIEIARTFCKPITFGHFSADGDRWYLSEFPTYDDYITSSPEARQGQRRRVNRRQLSRVENVPLLVGRERVVVILNHGDVP